MKIWQKIFLLSFLCAVLLVNITSSVIAWRYFQSTLQKERIHETNDTIALISNISDYIEYTKSIDNKLILSEDTVREIIQKKLSESNKEQQYQVLHQENTIVSSVNFPGLPQDFEGRSEHTAQSRIFQDDSGRSILLIDVNVMLEHQDYTFIFEQDISDIYETYRAQLHFIRITAIIGSAVLSSILFLLIHILMLPQKRINRVLYQIAEGNYSARTPEKGSAEFRHLAEVVNETANAIETNFERLKEIADSRKQFVDSLAHEMKTPLTSILCFSDLMYINRTLDDDKRVEYSGIILEEARRLKALSGKLLEIASAGNAPLEMSPVFIPDLLSEIKNSYSPLLAVRKINLSISPVQAHIMADKELFKSILFNLIDNAAKASKDGESIQIQCAIKNKKIAIAVIDHGIGMTKEQMRRAFEPFYMADKARSRKSGGAGLGLALCTEIAKRHHAKLSVKSLEGKGTVFMIRMATCDKMMHYASSKGGDKS